MKNKQQCTQMLDVLKQVVNDSLLLAKQEGASAAEIGASTETGLAVNVRLGETETIEYHQGQGIGVTVYFGQKKGSASTNDTSPMAIKETVAAACRIAKYATEDNCAGLPDESLLAQQCPDLDLYHPWEIDADTAITMALACESAARSFSEEITNSEGASFNSYTGLRVMANSLGFMHGYASTRHSISCSVIGQRNDDMQRDDWWTVARDPAELDSPENVGKTAALRTVNRLGSRSLSSRKCPVLFDADVAGSLIGHFVAGIQGGSLYRKSSFLLDTLGKSIFPDFMHIHEQPSILKALGSVPHDAEGVRVIPRDIITDGVLQSYVLASYSARKLGLISTGNAGGVHNLTVDSGTLDRNSLLSALGTGLLVTELLGQGVNIVTGDYSRGVAGYWVENGVIQYPVEEITIAGNLRDMFKNLVAVGADQDRRGNIWTGSLLLDEMTVAGN